MTGCEKLHIRDLLHNTIASVLWGDRKKYGLNILKDDPSWKEWGNIFSKFYITTQHTGIGKFVNDAGYRIMSHVDLSQKTIIEIGPGDIRHTLFWNGSCPSMYNLADIRQDMLDKGKQELQKKGIPTKEILLERESFLLPLPDQSVDIIVSFYSLEHIYPLAPYLTELKRILRPNGVLVGAIPTEGGVAWGLGRFLTTRRWAKKYTKVNYDKIICWEHPNFADEIISVMDSFFTREKLIFSPIPFMPCIDFNLIIKFIYRRLQ